MSAQLQEKKDALAASPTLDAVRGYLSALSSVTTLAKPPSKVTDYGRYGVIATTMLVTLEGCSTVPQQPPTLSSSLVKGDVPPQGTIRFWISRGQIGLPDGSTIEAYSGSGDLMNNPAPASYKAKAAGPTPPGIYSLSMPHVSAHLIDTNNKPAVVMNMEPIKGTDTFGRNAMELHGDMGSIGCIAVKRPDDLHRIQDMRRSKAISQIEVKL